MPEKQMHFNHWHFTCAYANLKNTFIIVIQIFREFISILSDLLCLKII